jgi:hypothetical protein
MITTKQPDKNTPAEAKALQECFCFLSFFRIFPKNISTKAYILFEHLINLQGGNNYELP